MSTHAETTAAVTPHADDARPVLITGGAGFVGCNLAHRLLERGERVLLFDNLSRDGVEWNLAWLRETHGDLVSHLPGDVRDSTAVRAAVRRASAVYHFAAQVAVTTSLVDPADDFEVNARGTFNVLEAARRCETPPPVIFTSTNKVYGDLSDVRLRRDGRRYEPVSGAGARGASARGVSEERTLDFHSPYGCSKGTADQYVLDWARSYGLRTAVFRMSCIYGPHQFGTEDQGWVAHFLIRALDGEPIAVYGDGRQLRDVLFVEDLVDAFLLARAHIDRVAGQVFNVGGGTANTTSLIELLDRITELQGERPEVRYEGWRTGDQRWYVSDTAKISAMLGWSPRTSVEEGVTRLRDWLLEARAVRALTDHRSVAANSVKGPATVRGATASTAPGSASVRGAA